MEIQGSRYKSKSYYWKNYNAVHIAILFLPASLVILRSFIFLWTNWAWYEEGKKLFELNRLLKYF